MMILLVLLSPLTLIMAMTTMTKMVVVMMMMMVVKEFTIRKMDSSVRILRPFVSLFQEIVICFVRSTRKGGGEYDHDLLTTERMKFQ